MVGASKRLHAHGLVLLVLLAALTSLVLHSTSAQGALGFPHDDEALQQLMSEGADTPKSTSHATKPRPHALPRPPHPKWRQGPVAELFRRVTSSGGSLTNDCPTQRVTITNSSDLAKATNANTT